MRVDGDAHEAPRGNKELECQRTKTALPNCTEAPSGSGVLKVPRTNPRGVLPMPFRRCVCPVAARTGWAQAALNSMRLNTHCPTHFDVTALHGIPPPTNRLHHWQGYSTRDPRIFISSRQYYPSLLQLRHLPRDLLRTAHPLPYCTILFHCLITTSHARPPQRRNRALRHLRQGRQRVKGLDCL
jgi:hypothetical protein